GRSLWDVKLGTFGRGHATPMVWKDQIILHRGNEVAGYSRKDGSRLWWLSASTQGTGTPVIHGDLLFVGAWNAEEDLRDPVPDWDSLLKQYDKNGDGKLSKAEFPDDLAIVRRSMPAIPREPWSLISASSTS